MKDYNHDAESMFEACGITQEIAEKGAEVISNMMTNAETQSERVEAIEKMITEDPNRIRVFALMFVDQYRKLANGMELLSDLRENIPSSGPMSIMSMLESRATEIASEMPMERLRDIARRMKDEAGDNAFARMKLNELIMSAKGITLEELMKEDKDEEEEKEDEISQSKVH